MPLLGTLLQQKMMEAGKNAKQLTLLPNDVVNALKKRIREGAEDQEQNWANALELVHKAYEVEGVVRPDPAMADAWKQYEEMLAYAVQQLAKNRGMDSDWRMSASMFHEALNQKQFTVHIEDETFVTEGESIDAVAKSLAESMPDLDVNIVTEGDTRLLLFSKWGIKNPQTVTITEETIS